MTMRAAAMFMAVMMAASPAFGQTATKFNLTCTPVSSTFTGNDSNDYPLMLDDFGDVAGEVIDLAVDLDTGTSCNPHYCTPETFGKPEPLMAISSGKIVFDDIAPREVELEDYQIMGYRLELDRHTLQTTTIYTFLDEVGGHETGHFTLVKACKASPYKLSKE